MKEIEWDDRVYELGVFRCKDMYERGYFDHKDPDGKCAVNYAADFNINWASIPENSWMIGFSESDKSLSYFDCQEPVDSWMESRGHRFNLLYSAHTKGAISCYGNKCVFLALSFGNFPCASAAEGVAFWETAPIQPEERRTG